MDITNQIFAGSSINYAAKLAVDTAIEHGCAVTFKFNDVALTASPNDDPESIVTEFHSELTRQHDAYKASPQYQEDQARDAANLLTRQAHLNTLLENLPGSIRGGISTTVAWCGQFAEASDWVSVLYDKGAVVRLLEAAGYINDDYVGPSVNIDTDEKYGRWIIGQVISGLSSSGMVHPVCEVFAQRYADGTWKSLKA